MTMELASRGQASGAPMAVYRIIKWPAHVLDCQIPQTYSSLRDNIPNITPNSSQVFETAQTTDDIVPEYNLPDNPAYLANKILKKLVDKRALKIEMYSQLTPLAQPCPYCKKSFQSSSHWRRHVNLHTEEVKYPCPLCEKVFLDKSTLSRHKKIHSGDKPWKCKMCDKCFHTLPSLRRHVTVHNPAGRPFECNICHKRFPDKSSQQKHIFLHTGLRPHACNVCNKSFVYLSDLNCHMKIHTDTKEFICSHCKKEFSKLGNYQRHVKIHEGNMTFRCPVCHICYNFRSSLTRHMLAHRQEKLRKSCIICRFCEARFLNRSALKRHLLLHFVETVEQSIDVDVQSNELLRNNCDSRNDVNKRPLTHKEISFVRKNLKYCRVVHLDKLPKNDSKISHYNQARKEEIAYKSEVRQTKDVENIEVNSESKSLRSGISVGNRKGWGLLAVSADQVQDINANKCDNTKMLQIKRRGRPRKQHFSLLASGSLDTRHSSELAVTAKLKNDQNAVKKRKRGRPRKTVHNCVNNEVVGTEYAEMLHKSIKISSDNVSEHERCLSTPRRNLRAVFNKSPLIQEVNNSECVLNLKRKRGRPRKVGNICFGNEKNESDQKNMIKSRKAISKPIVDQKRKRGRPRKTFIKDELLQCQSDVRNNKMVMTEVSESFPPQNHKICAGEIDRNQSNEIDIEAGEEPLHAKTTKGNINTVDNETVIFGSENVQQCRLGYSEAEQSGKIKQSKSDEKTSKIRLCQKQTQPKQVLVCTEGEKKCFQTDDKEVNDGVGEKAKMFHGENRTVFKSRDCNCEKENGRYKQQICDVGSSREQELVNHCTKSNFFPCTRTVDTFKLISTNEVEEKCCSIMLSHEDMQKVDSGGEKKLLKQNGKRKIPVFIIHDNEVFEDYNITDRSCVYVEETEFENYEQAKRTENGTETAHINNAQEDAGLHSTKFQGSLPENYFSNTRSMVEIKSVENDYKKLNWRSFFLIQGEEEAVVKVQECDADNVTVMKDIGCMRKCQKLRNSSVSEAEMTDATCNFMKRDVKEVLLEDWQSDDSQSSRTSEIK